MYKLFEYLSTLLYYEINEINENIKTNGCSLEPDTKNYNGSDYLLKSMDFIFYMNGRFPGTHG